MVRTPAPAASKSGGDEGSESKEPYDPGLNVEGLIKTFARCKWFNVAKGFGFVSFEEPTHSDGDDTAKPPPDVFVYQSAIKMPGFRSLREGEKVEVWYRKSEKGFEAVRVSGPGGSDCLGSEKRPKRRKKAADRCYNCDECGHHAKECKLPPLPKRCHHCKSVDHLVADCPSKRDRAPVTSQQTHHREEHDRQQHEQQQRHLPQSNNHDTSTPPPTSQTQMRYS